MLLVTGGAGYVGSHFLHEYLRPGNTECVVLDNLFRGHAESLGAKGATFVEGEIGDQALLDRLFKQYKIEAVVHFAAYAYVGESQEVPFKYLQNNIVQSINLFEAMDRNDVRKIVFSSTCSSYGVPDYVPIDEKHPQRPVNVYGNSKLIVEKVLHSLAQAREWSFMALRYFNAAGAVDDATLGESHDPETHLIPLVLKVASGELPHVKIHGDDYETPDGTCIRDYIHVTDLARAHCQALDLLNVKPAGTSECINLGTEHGASVKEVISVCEAVTGKKIAAVVGPRRSGDPARLVANATQAEKVLGWKPQYDLKGIVETAWRWEQNRRY
ncbi:MAG TPA: UDP-glucose 4-epimerase GalE [Trichormus sp.]|jgi:UDP-glucose 4-epimerase